MEIVLPVENKIAIHPVAIFSAGIKIWQKNFLAYSVIYLVLYIPSFILALTMSLLPPAVAQALPAIINIAANVIVWLLSIWAGIALMLAAAKGLGNSAVSIGESIKETRHYFFSYLGAALLTILLVLAALLILAALMWLLIGITIANQIALGVILTVLLLIAAPVIVAAVYFLVRFSVFGPVCALENKGSIACLRRSHELVKSYVNPVVGEYILFMLLGLIYITPVMILAAWLKDAKQAGIITAVISNLLGLFYVPIGACIWVVLYNKLKEAVDSYVCP